MNHQILLNNSNSLASRHVGFRFTQYRYASLERLGVSRKDIVQYPAQYSKHPLFRRVDIADEIQLWAFRKRVLPIKQTEIPVMSNNPIPPPLKSLNPLPDVYYPPLHKFKPSQIPDFPNLSNRDWLLTKVSLTINRLAELDVDAIVLTTDKTFRFWDSPLGTESLKKQESITLAEQMNVRGIHKQRKNQSTYFCKKWNKISHYKKKNLIKASNIAFRNWMSHLRRRLYTNLPSCKVHLVQMYSIGTLAEVPLDQHCAKKGILLVRPHCPNEKTFKKIVFGILDFADTSHYKSLAIRPFHLTSKNATPHFLIAKWTAECLRDWMVNKVKSGKLSLDESECQTKQQIPSYMSYAHLINQMKMQIILVVESEAEWKLLHQMTKILLSGTKHDIRQIKPISRPLYFSSLKKYRKYVITDDEKSIVQKIKEKRERRRKVATEKKQQKKIKERQKILGVNVDDPILDKKPKNKMTLSFPIPYSGVRHEYGDYKRIYSRPIQSSK